MKHSLNLLWSTRPNNNNTVYTAANNFSNNFPQELRQRSTNTFNPSKNNIQNVTKIENSYINSTKNGRSQVWCIFLRYEINNILNNGLF